LYDEDSGLLNNPSSRAVNVTAYFISGVNMTETFEVNGTYSYGSNYQPLYFKFHLVNTREYWLCQDETTATIYIFNATTTVYTISFVDLAGALDDNPIVEAQRHINGTSHTIEKRKVDIEDKILMALKNGEKYTITLRDGSSHTYGDLLMTSTTTVTLTLKGIEFPKETLMTYKYVRTYGVRAFGTPNGNITITYQDTLKITNQVDIYINYKNGTNAYTGAETADSFNHIWTSALNNTDYQVVLSINHSRYGVYPWKQYFPRTFSDNPWGLGFLGSLPFDTAIIIPSLLILFAAGCFSQINGEVGAFMAVVIAAALAYIGYITIGPSALVVAFTLAVIMAILYAKRRIQT